MAGYYACGAFIYFMWMENTCIWGFFSKYYSVLVYSAKTGKWCRKQMQKVNAKLNLTNACICVKWRKAKSNFFYQNSKSVTLTSRWWAGVRAALKKMFGPLLPFHQIRTKSSKYSRLSLSRIPRNSLKHFEISIPRHIRVEGVSKIINWTTTFNKWMCNLTPEVRNIYIK